MTNLSSSVPIKQLNASFGVLTIGSPLTLKEVFINTGQFVFSLNFLIKLKKTKIEKSPRKITKTVFSDQKKN